MTQLEQCMGWLEERVPTSASAKDYIKFIMQDYAQKYHESKVKELGLFSVSQRSELLAFLAWYRERPELHDWSIDIAVEQYEKANCG